MTDLLEQLRRQAEGIDAVEPVTAAEARNRAEWSPYSPDTEPRPGPATRRRRGPLVAAAAVLVAVLAVASAVTWNADRTAPGPAASAPAYYLPPAPPPGMHLAAKIDAPGRTPRIVASLARSDPPGRIVVVASPAPAQPELGDFADAVDVGGRSGTITSNADGSTDVAFTAGSATYVVTSSSTTDDFLLAVARSLRADGDHVAVEPPEGWRLLAPVAYADTAVHLTYIDDGLGIAVVDVYPAGGALVDQIAATEPGVTVLGHGAARVVVETVGPVTVAYHRLAGDAYTRVWATNSYADHVPSDLARSVAEVSQATWDATTPDPGHAVPYEPDPVRYLPLLTAGSTRLEYQPGPGGTWCLRPVPAPTAAGGTCISQLDAGGIGTATLAGPGLSGRVVFGVASAAGRDVSVTLADGTQVLAMVAPIPGEDVCAWMAVLAPDARVRSIDGRDATGHTVVWHVGRPDR